MGEGVLEVFEAAARATLSYCKLGKKEKTLNISSSKQGFRSLLGHIGKAVSSSLLYILRVRQSAVDDSLFGD
jgi:hypothetical protein